MTAPKLLTPTDVADTLAVSKMTVYRLIETRQLRAYRVGKSLRIERQDFIEYLERADTFGGAA